MLRNPFGVKTMRKFTQENRPCHLVKCATSKLARQAPVLEKEMIIWVGARCKPSLARQACVPKIEMIIWVG